jgi:hypothetical protein
VPGVPTQAASEPTWTAKEVFTDLKRDLLRRFDKTDQTLEAIDRRLDNAATRDDVSQLHRRIDGVELAINERFAPLEQQASDEKAIEQNRGRFRSNLAWVAGIAGTLAIVGSVVVPLLVH